MSKKKPLPKKPYNKGVEELGIPSTQHNADLIAYEIEKKEVEKHNEAVEAELKELADKPVELSKVTEGYPVLEVNYPTEPTFEERELNKHNDVFEQMPTGQLIEEVEADRAKLKEGFIDFTAFNEALVRQVEERKNSERESQEYAKVEINIVDASEHIEDEVTNKVVLEQAIEQTLPQQPQVIYTEDGPKDAAELKPAVFDQGFLASVNYTFDTDENFTEDVRMQEGKRWVDPPAEKLELTNTSPNIKVSEDFSREAINELGRIAPYMRYANFPVQVETEIVLHNTSGGAQRDDCKLPEDILDDIGYTYEAPKLPPVNSLVAPKTVKAIEQAPVVNNGGTITPQVPQAQPVGRQRHTFKARPDKEGRNV